MCYAAMHSMWSMMIQQTSAECVGCLVAENAKACQKRQACHKHGVEQLPNSQDVLPLLRSALPYTTAPNPEPATQLPTYVTWTSPKVQEVMLEFLWRHQTWGHGWTWTLGTNTHWIQWVVQGRKECKDILRALDISWKKLCKTLKTRLQKIKKQIWNVFLWFEKMHSVCGSVFATLGTEPAAALARPQRQPAG